MKTRLLITLLLLTALFGCRSKKIATSESIHKEDSSEIRIERTVDTAYNDRVVTKTKPVYSEIIIEKPCDSLGNLNPIFANIGSGGNQSTISTQDGKLILNQHIDSTRSSMETFYRTKFVSDSIALRKELLKEDAQVTEVVRTVYPWWFYVLIGVAGIVIVLRVLKKFNWLGVVKGVLSKVLIK